TVLVIEPPLGKCCPAATTRPQEKRAQRGRSCESTLTAARGGSSVVLVSCSVICVSHATGSGGDEVGRLVAERLGFLHLDEEIVAGAAARGGVSPADVADEERRKSLATRILGLISEGSGSAMALGG